MADLEDDMKKFIDKLSSMLPSERMSALKIATEALDKSLEKTRTRANSLAQSLEDSNKGAMAWTKASKNFNSEVNESIRIIKNSSASQKEYTEKLKEYAEEVTKGLDPDLALTIQKNIESTGKLVYKQEEYGKILEEVKKPLGALGTAAGNIVKSYQAGGSQIGVASAALQGGLDVVTNSANVAGNAAKSTGDAMMNSSNKWTKGLGSLLSVAGTGLNAFSNTLSTVAKAVLPILQTELEKAISNFQSISSTGAVFSGGLTEMIKMSGQAGMTLDMFGKVLNQNKEAFASSGLGMAGAAKRFSEVSNVMGDKGFKGQLLNLGYSIEEQGGLVADTFRNMQRTGRLQGASAEDIAKTSVEYGKNLRAISDITGQDAKAKMAAAQKDMDALDVQAKLLKLQQEQPDVYNKVQAQLATMPEEMKAGFLQMFTGGTITDPATRVLMDRVPGLEAAYEKMVSDANNSSMTASQAIESTKSALATARQGFIENADALADIGKAARLGAGGIAADIQGLGGKLIGGLAPFTEATTGAAERINAAANTQDKATQAINDVIQKNIELATQIQNQILTPNVIGAFADTVAKASGAVSGLISQFAGEKPKAAAGAPTAEDKSWVGQKWDSMMNWMKQPGNLSGALQVGAGAAGIAAAAGAPTVIGGVTMGAVAGVLQGLSMLSGALGFAKGGISTGEETGYLQKLHGSELIVPLTSASQLDINSNGYKELMNLFSTSTITAGSATAAPAQNTGNMEAFAKSLSDSISNVVGNILPTIANPISAISKGIDLLAKTSNEGDSTKASNVLSNLPQSPVDTIMKTLYEKIEVPVANKEETAQTVPAAIIAQTDSQQQLYSDMLSVMRAMNIKLEDMIDHLRDVSTHTKNTADAVG
jgi:hypothetical protein